jgi:hypothetical protein
LGKIPSLICLSLRNCLSYFCTGKEPWKRNIGAPILIIILKYCHLKIEIYVYREIFEKTVSSYEETCVQNFIIMDFVFA